MTSHGSRIAFALIAFVLASPLLLLSGCGSSGATSTSTNMDCGKDGFICDPAGVPFAQTAVAVSDLCGGLVADCPLAANPPPASTTATLTQPESGKVCLAGTVAQGGGWAVLGLGFSTWNPDGTTILKAFDATSLGIARASFTIDSPLVGGLTVGAFTTPPAPVECAFASCFTGFDLDTAPASGTTVTLSAPGPQSAPFANFQATGGGAQSFDTTALELIAFNPTGPGDYAFCISDFKFLDASGNEVKP